MPDQQDGGRGGAGLRPGEHAAEDEGSPAAAPQGRGKIFNIFNHQCWRRHIHVSQVDHVSDNFLAHVSPLDLLVEAAGRADEAAVSLYAEVGENN